MQHQTDMSQLVVASSSTPLQSPVGSQRENSTTDMSPNGLPYTRHSVIGQENCQRDMSNGNVEQLTDNSPLSTDNNPSNVNNNGGADQMSDLSLQHNNNRSLMDGNMTAVTDLIADAAHHPLANVDYLAGIHPASFLPQTSNSAYMMPPGLGGYGMPRDMFASFNQFRNAAPSMATMHMAAAATSGYHRRYPCKLCQMAFDSKAELQSHNQAHMREAKPYKCTHCIKTFANSSYLSQHMRIHLNIKPFGPCQYCGRKFTQLSHLQQHLRTHTGEKPYKCKSIGCEKAFSQLSNLQSHTRCHQTDKPYKCNSCYKCFSDEQSLLDHIPKHRESKHLKIHICPYCGKSYTQATYLQKHMTKHADRRDRDQKLREMTTGSNVPTSNMPMPLAMPQTALDQAWNNNVGGAGNQQQLMHQAHNMSLTNGTTTNNTMQTNGQHNGQAENGVAENTPTPHLQFMYPDSFASFANQPQYGMNNGSSSMGHEAISRLFAGGFPNNSSTARTPYGAFPYNTNDFKNVASNAANQTAFNTAVTNAPTAVSTAAGLTHSHLIGLNTIQRFNQMGTAAAVSTADQFSQMLANRT